MSSTNAPTVDFDVFPSEASLLTDVQTPQPLVDQPTDIFPPAVHEAVFTVLNGKATKELVEQIVLSRQAHLRNGEDITLIEHDADDVIHVQFNTLVSVQMLIADLNHHKIPASLELNWGN